MKYLFSFFYLCLFSNLLFASEFHDSNAGTYLILSSDNKTPTEFFYRLSKVNGKWLAEGKNKEHPEWQDISCQEGCDFKNSSAENIEKYFGADWLKKFDIGCIENKANAICHLKLKENQEKDLYMMVGLSEAKYIKIMLAPVVYQ